ncbi:MAG: hypothetical protein MZV64_70510 [Ignavibacteriales bacterium]|nr:hypothetical protein [Ignavibacteriales bacterium]
MLGQARCPACDRFCLTPFAMWAILGSEARWPGKRREIPPIATPLFLSKRGNAPQRRSPPEVHRRPDGPRSNLQRALPRDHGVRGADTFPGSPACTGRSRSCPPWGSATSPSSPTSGARSRSWCSSRAWFSCWSCSHSRSSSSSTLHGWKHTPRRGPRGNCPRTAPGTSSSRASIPSARRS